MANEILLYGPIDCEAAKEFIEDVNEVVEESGNEDVTIRVNSDGGEVRYGWGAITKFSELKGKKLVKNDGAANSMAAFFFCYAADSEGIDTCEFYLHRAGYPEWIENDPKYFTDEDREALARMNKSLRAALEGKIDVDKFNALGKGTIDQMFSMDGRLGITLTAKEAKKVGLMNRIITITPSKKSEIQAKLIQITATRSGLRVAAVTEPITPKPMITTETLKAENPGVYAQIFELGKTAGVTEATAKEKERVEAWAHFMEVDPKAVKEGIASGKALTQLQIIELSEKKFSAKALKEIGEESSVDTPTNTPEATTAKSKELADFKAGVIKNSTRLS